MVGIFVQGFWFGLYLVDHGMIPGHVLTTFYACLAAVQSIETVLPQWLVLAKGISAGRHLNSIMTQMEHSRHVNYLAGLKPMASPGDIEVKEVSLCTSLRNILIHIWHGYHFIIVKSATSCIEKHNVFLSSGPNHFHWGQKWFWKEYPGNPSDETLQSGPRIYCHTRTFDSGSRCRMAATEHHFGPAGECIVQRNSLPEHYFWQGRYCCIGRCPQRNQNS